MENHPIPQDVTGFKFKLIGSVTVKQFLYLIGGGILAVVCFVLPVPGIIKYPLSFLFGGVGTALAFIPIEGRPMDVMMKNFLKALPAENQYIFRKKGAEALIAEFFTPPTVAAVKTQVASEKTSDALDTKRALLFKTLRQSYKPDEKEEAVLKNINSFLNESSHSATPSVQRVDENPQGASPIQVASPTAITPPVSPEAIKIVTPIPGIPKETVIAKPSPKVRVVESPTIVSTPAQEPEPAKPETPKVELVAQPVPAPQPATEEPVTPHVSATPQETIPQTPTPMTTTAAPSSATPAVAPNETINVTSVAPAASLKAGFPELPDTPNIVMGIIKDPRGRIIPNILVEIMDLQGIPVRAFKTNALGQFAAATPLPNGEYNVVLEDPRKQNEFEQIQITLNGEIFQPLEIISVDQREKLRRELFGGTQSAQAQA